MIGSVIVLGANGRFGRAAIKAFRKQGWKVTALVRKSTEDTHADATVVCSAFDAKALTAAVTGHDVIVNALNPVYERWKTDIPILTQNVIAAAKASNATVMIPGNIYNYGKELPNILTEETPHIANTRKGALRIEMEEAYRAASEDIQTIILRAGDFIEHAKTGNWFDSYIANKAKDGKITYPGELDIPHTWAYLPDMAHAMACLAEKRETLSWFEDIGFDGFSLTGRELVTKIESATGKKQKVATLPWPILKLLALFSPRMREVLEMRYLWERPHRINGAKLKSVLPGFTPTPAEEAVREALQC